MVPANRLMSPQGALAWHIGERWRAALPRRLCHEFLSTRCVVSNQQLSEKKVSPRFPLRSCVLIGYTIRMQLSDWIELRNAAQRDRKAVGYLMQESRCAYNTILKAKQGEAVQADVAQRISAATAGLVTEGELTCP